MKQNIKTKIALAFLLFGSSAVFYSCEEKEDAGFKGFELSESDYVFTQDGGIQLLNISTDKSWSAKTDADWLLISPASGIGSAECEIKVDSSYSYNKRNAQILIQTEGESKVIAISQFGYEKLIQLKESEINVPHYKTIEEANFEVEVLSNVAYEVIIDENNPWVKFDSKTATSYEPSSATPAKTTYKFTYEPNSDFRSTRVSEITFKQKADSDPIVATFVVEQNKAAKIIPSRAGDSLALLSIQNQIKVYGSGWDSSRPISHWNNVITELVDYTYIDEELGIETDTTELRVTGVRFFMFNTVESVPSDIQYLQELEVLIFLGNENRQLKSIELGPEVTKLKNLKSLSINGYGISSLPKEIVEMENLEELDLFGNSFLQLPMDIITQMKGLKYIAFSSNKRVDAIDNLSEIPTGVLPENIGLRGSLPIELFQLENLEYILLSNNYFEGSIPDMPVGTMPQLKRLYLNLNRLTGEIPQWILQHERLACWDPFTLIFNQEGRDANNVPCGFTNEPKRLPNPDCPDWETETETVDVYLNPSIRKYDENYLPLTGNWRNFKYNYIK